jgi:hypothetical protein
MEDNQQLTIDDEFFSYENFKKRMDRVNDAQNHLLASPNYRHSYCTRELILSKSPELIIEAINELEQSSVVGSSSSSSVFSQSISAHRTS